MVRTNTTGTAYPSLSEGRPQKSGFLMKSVPARFDVGMLFRVNDNIEMQLTGQVCLDLFKNRGNKVDFSIQPEVSYSAGWGMDIKLSKSVLWGFGISYSHDILSDKEYYHTLEAISMLRLQSLSFGTGLIFPWAMQLNSVFLQCIRYIFPLTKVFLSEILG